MSRFAFPAFAPRDRRAVLIGLAIIAPALLYMFVLKPYHASLLDLQQQTEAQRGLLERELAVLAAGPSLPIELNVARQRVARAEARLVRSADEPIAEAELTRYFEDLAGRSRVLLQEMRGVALGRAVRPPPGTRILRMTLRGESDLNGIAKFIQGIETGPLLLDIAELSIEPKPQQQQQPARGRPRGPAPQEGVLQFQIVVQAFAPAPPSEEVVP